MPFSNNETSLKRQQKLRKQLDEIVSKEFLVTVFDADKPTDDTDANEILSDQYISHLLNPSEEEMEKFEKELHFAFTPLRALSGYLKNCETEEEGIVGLSIYLEKMIRLSNEIKIPESEAWGLLIFLAYTEEGISKIFTYIFNYLVSEIEIIFPENSSSFIAKGSEFALSIFNSTFGLLIENEAFFDFCGDKIKRKYYEFLKIKKIKRNNNS